MKSKWDDNKPREYYSKYRKIETKNNQDWFEVYELPGDVIGICEPKQFQEVNQFLIRGTERALLLDTGMGIADIKPLVEELYDGEIIVVNSHFHFDHIANNSHFDSVYAFENEYVAKVAENGLPKEALGDQLEEIMFRYGYPEGFNPDNYSIEPFNINKIHDGHIFDLGDRKIEVIHTPGHSNDGIMLYDEANRELFTGDTYYTGTLYAHFACEEFGYANIDDYIKSMERVADLEDKLDRLYCSHRDFTASITKLKEVAEALRKIRDKTVMPANHVKEGHSYLQEEYKMVEYIFNEFSIICSEKE